jgi:hypothetical protein
MKVQLQKLQKQKPDQEQKLNKEQNWNQKQEQNHQPYQQQSSLFPPFSTTRTRAAVVKGRTSPGVNATTQQLLFLWFILFIRTLSDKQRGKVHLCPPHLVLREVSDDHPPVLQLFRRRARANYLFGVPLPYNSTTLPQRSTNRAAHTRTSE